MSCMLVVFAVVACSPDRPSPEAWSGQWHRATDVTAHLTASGALDTRSECKSLLVWVRENRSLLLPTPDSILDVTVEEWIEATERLGFTCPRVDGEPNEQIEMIRKIRTLEAEIEAGLSASDRIARSQASPEA